MRLEYVIPLLVMVSPFTEVRGGIPLLLLEGMSPLLVVLLAILGSFLIFSLGWMALSVVFSPKTLERLPIVSRPLFWVRRRVSRHMEIGKWGLVPLVAIPLPMTGVYTGTLVAWGTGMRYREAVVPIMMGAVLASVVVLGLTMAGIALWNL